MGCYLKNFSHEGFEEFRACKAAESGGADTLTLTSITPISAVGVEQGLNPVTLTLAGTGFEVGDQVRLCEPGTITPAITGGPLTVVSPEAGEVVGMQLPQGTVQPQPKTYDLLVRRAGPPVFVSNPLPFTITAP